MLLPTKRMVPLSWARRYSPPLRTLRTQSNNQKSVRLFISRDAQHVAEAVVALVAGVFVDRAAGPGPCHHRRPLARPHRRIVDRELVRDRVWTRSREPF